ncbi:hypothetical protein X808_14790 [Mannheimia varigena USDA-ARS-USMARC-1296]|uniref:Uncharacterized protein n=1 Tax=Mannheimia varigena USDA-ARS-USMARC-1296 TaxID=1433287 RepID=W0QBR8_9PAST|nr:hypothetical protein X808_14790 [Mannheimia varigena USDA-ARS-USMARC-1296]
MKNQPPKAKMQQCVKRSGKRTGEKSYIIQAVVFLLIFCKKFPFFNRLF